MFVIAEWKELTLDELGFCQYVLREEEFFFLWVEGILCMDAHRNIPRDIWSS